MNGPAKAVTEPAENWTRPVRLAYLVTHPIQYQAPLLRLIAADPQIELKVFFCSDLSLREFYDPGFGTKIEWDVPLLEGYEHEFLPAWGDLDALSAWRPFSYGLAKRLALGRFDALWIHGYARPFHLAAMLAAKRQGIKVLLRDEASAISTSRGRVKRAIKQIFFAALDRLVDGFLAIGTLNANYYRQHGIADQKIHLVPYAVDNARFRREAEVAHAERDAFRAALALTPGHPVILYASKLMGRKRADDLLQAYRVLARDWDGAIPYLLYVGDGELLEPLQREVEQHNLSHVKFLGFQGQAELPRFFDLADVFVLTSFDEPWGLVINEAMNAGTSVIASDRVGSAYDLIRDGENGYVVPAGDVNALTRALKETLADPKHCAAMGAVGRETVWSWGFDQDLAGLKKALAAVLPVSLGSKRGTS